MQGFPKATPPIEVIMVPPEVTPVASTFSLPTDVVTINTHCFSPPTWSEGVGGWPAGLPIWWWEQLGSLPWQG